MTQGTVFNLRNILLLLGIILTGTGIVFFATTFIERLSDWGRVAALLLLAVVVIALGRHFETTERSAVLIEKKGWRWLRVPTTLYLLGLLATFTGAIVFFGIDSVGRLVKAGVAIGVGLGVILFTARRFDADHGGPDHEDEP